jgi:hypothetical protein
MHILIGMAIASILIIGWAMGNLFCAVFLSLAPAAGAIILLAQKTGPSPWALACFALIAVIWAPIWLRAARHRIESRVWRFSDYHAEVRAQERIADLRLQQPRK